MPGMLHRRTGRERHPAGGRCWPCKVLLVLLFLGLPPGLSANPCENLGAYADNAALRAAFEADPLCTLPSGKPVSVELSSRLDRARAIQILRSAIQAAQQRPAGGLPRIVDAYVFAAFADSSTVDRVLAANSYLAVLDSPGLWSPDERNLLSREREVAAILAPRLGPIEQPHDLPRWAAWWRAADPMPSTDRNERLEEHLQRLVRAAEEYGGDAEREPLDDRARLYIRFGAPDAVRKISHARAISFIGNPGANFSMSDLPDAVVWLYPSVAAEASYLLFKRAKGYAVGSVGDPVAGATALC